MPRPALLAAVLAIFAAGCGGGEQAAADPEAVIEDWIETLSSGDIEGAAEFFALPSTVRNGPLLVLATRNDAVLFNQSLPCGAELLRTEPAGERIHATFRLTERPGPGECGAGSGGLVRTAFLIEDGKIAEWLRLSDVAEPSQPGPPV